MTNYSLFLEAYGAEAVEVFLNKKSLGRYGVKSSYKRPNQWGRPYKVELISRFLNNGKNIIRNDYD